MSSPAIKDESQKGKKRESMKNSAGPATEHQRSLRNGNWLLLMAGWVRRAFNVTPVAHTRCMTVDMSRHIYQAHRTRSHLTAQAIIIAAQHYCLTLQRSKKINIYFFKLCLIQFLYIYITQLVFMSHKGPASGLVLVG